MFVFECRRVHDTCSDLFYKHSLSWSSNSYLESPNYFGQFCRQKHKEMASFWHLMMWTFSYVKASLFVWVLECWWIKPTIWIQVKLIFIFWHYSHINQTSMCWPSLANKSHSIFYNDFENIDNAAVGWHRSEEKYPFKVLLHEQSGILICVVVNWK